MLIFRVKIDQNGRFGGPAPPQIFWPPPQIFRTDPQIFRTEVQLGPEWMTYTYTPFVFLCINMYTIHFVTGGFIVVALAYGGVYL